MLFRACCDDVLAGDEDRPNAARKMHHLDLVAVNKCTSGTRSEEERAVRDSFNFLVTVSHMNLKVRIFDAYPR